jgi:hypothetical protein
LFLDPQFVGLHLSEVVGLFDQMLLYRLALHAASRHPTCYRALVEAKRRDDGLRRTAVGEERQHARDRVSWGPQAVKRRAFGVCEGSMTLCTDKALVLARVDADIALANLASGRTRQIGAE